MSKKTLSVCIAAYNRHDKLRPLLDSILSDSENLDELLICEDMSPERELIRDIVSEYIKKYGNLIKYVENDQNLGYDANLRNLVANASSDFITFVNNDDLLADGAVSKIARFINDNPDASVICRSYSTFYTDPNVPNELFIYFKEDRVFENFERSISTFYRRSVVLSGITFKREFIKNEVTDKYDGSLLYQLYYVIKSLQRGPGFFISDVIANYRLDGIPDFGNAPSERRFHTPTKQTPESSVNFMKFYLKIAFDNLDSVCYKNILADLSNYSYPVLAIQRNLGLIKYFKYCSKLSALGIGSKYFTTYKYLLMILNVRITAWGIRTIKRWYGSTPIIGNVESGNILK